MQTKRSLGMSRKAEVAGNRLHNYGEGGARTPVFNNSTMATEKAEEFAIPWILSKIYAPSPIVNMDQTRDEGEGMIPRLYVPVVKGK